MGGAVSSGRDNGELVDNLMSGNYIRTRAVERVFRALDRADYMSAEARDQAYKDLAWRNGPLHLSAPCIYSEVMEALELKPGLSFLNIGSGTGYLSTLVGLIIGPTGISHGVEASPAVYEYANKKLSQFLENSVTLDEFDLCIPKYYNGNGLCLSPTHSYDRVYCGAGVVAKYENYFKQFIKVGGVLVMPLADQLVQLRRVSPAHWTRRNLLNVSFAHLSEPTPRDRDQLLTLEEQCPPALQVLARAAVRSAMRAGVQRRDPGLREPPPAPPPQPRQGPRRICIPYDATSDEEVSDAEWEDLIHFAEELSELHELDEAGGAHEMNALLSLVLSMGQNRAAGSLRFEPDEAPAQDAAEERERDEAPAAAPPDDDFIVFDVGVRAAVRRRARAPRPAPAAPPALAAPAAGSSSDEARPPRPDRSRTFWRDLSSSEDDAAQVKDNKRQKLDSGIGEGTASSGASPDKSDDKSEKSEKTSQHSSNSDDDDDDGDDGDTDMPWVESAGSSGSSGAGSESDADSEWEAGAAIADVIMGSELGKHPRCRRIALSASRRRGGRGARTRVSRPSESDSGAEEGAEEPAEEAAEEVAEETKEEAPAGEAPAPAEEGPCGSGARRCGAACGAPRPARGDPGDARRVRLSLAMKRAVRELPLPHALKKYINYNRCYQI